jgi:hypothetical protein
MELLRTIARYEAIILVAAFASLIVFKFFTGGITMRNLLCEKTSAGSSGVSAARVQLLLFTLAMAFYVLSRVVETSDFPVIETKYLLVLGGSHTVFLGAKGVSSLFSSEPR